MEPALAEQHAGWSLVSTVLVETFVALDRVLEHLGR